MLIFMYPWIMKYTVKMIKTYTYLYLLNLFPILTHSNFVINNKHTNSRLNIFLLSSVVLKRRERAKANHTHILNLLYFFKKKGIIILNLSMEGGRGERERLNIFTYTFLLWIYSQIKVKRLFFSLKSILK